MVSTPGTKVSKGVIRRTQSVLGQRDGMIGAAAPLELAVVANIGLLLPTTTTPSPLTKPVIVTVNTGLAEKPPGFVLFGCDRQGGGESGVSVPLANANA